MRSIGLTLLISLALAGNLYAGNSKHETPKKKNECVAAGPQAPRDIDNPTGSNGVVFEIAPPGQRDEPLQYPLSPEC